MCNLPTIPNAYGKKLKKSYRKSQPFWNEELENLWFAACQAEKLYLNFKPYTYYDQLIKSNLRINFKTAQKEFDKRFRALKRRYKNKDLNDLGKLAADNSPKIWEKTKKSE